MRGHRRPSRLIFDRASALYERARPEYPDELIDHLIHVTDVRPGDRLLEIGCATGKATLPIARRGFGVTCLEPGPNLAAAARSNLAAHPGVTVVEARFEDWTTFPPFDLVFAANAWHWLDAEVRYGRAWRALRPGGHLAFWNAAPCSRGNATGCTARSAGASADAPCAGTGEASCTFSADLSISGDPVRSWDEGRTSRSPTPEEPR